MHITNSSSPIEMKMENNQNKHFQRINVTAMNFSSTKNRQLLMVDSFSVSTLKSSLYIQIKPINSNLAYLIAVSLANELLFNLTSKIFDYYQIMCPNSSKFLC
jgi:hypothetical protein